MEFNLKNKVPLIILLLIFASFSILWSYISVMRVYSLNITVSGFGMVLQNGWSFLSNPLNQQSILHSIIFIIFPLFLFKSYSLVLAFQAIFITLGIFPLYGIALHILKKKHIAMMIAIAYLIYPYIAGMYWFSFLYQALFPTLFLTAYYFYLKERYKISLVLFLLSGLTLFSFMVFSILFSLITIIECLYHRRHSEYDRVKMHFSLILLISSLSIFLIINYSNINAGILGNMSMYIPKHIDPFKNIDYKMNVLLIVLVPLLALPVISKRFIIFFIPYFYALFYITTSPDIIPSFLSYQFAPLVLPFLFLGFIDTLQNLFEEENIEEPRTKVEKLKNELANPRFKFTALMLVLVILFATVYQPIGPFNQYSQANFDLKQSTSANFTVYNNLQKIISLILSNDPYVLTQNNLPEVYPRPLAYGMPLITGITNFTSNITATKIYINNSGKLIMPRIDYILSYLNSSWYLYGKPNMHNFNNILYSSGEYGILAEASGIVLLKKNYTGQIEYYAPMKENFNVNQLKAGPISTLKNGIIYANNISSWQIIWYGPYITLPPGVFNITFQLETSNNSKNNVLTLDVSNNTGKSVLFSIYVKGSEFSKINTWQNITITFNNTDFLNGVEFRGISSNWNGTIAIKGIYLKQVAPPYRSKEFFDLKYMMGLIPKNSTVIADKNLPDPIPGLLTDYNVIQANQITFTMPDYAIAGYPSSWFTKLYNSGEYGILAEVSGIILLKKNYTGPIEYYVPLSKYFSANQLNFEPYSTLENGTIYANNISKWQPIWYGPYITLPPGLFNITFQLETSNNSQSNVLTLDISNNSGKSVLFSIYVKGSEFSSINTWQNITITFNNTNFLSGVEFRGISSNWNGTIAIKGIYLIQVAPP